MTSSSLQSPVAAPTVAEHWRSGWFSKFFAFTPLWIRIYAYFAWQPLFHPMFTASGPFGIPQDVFLDGLVMFWMLIGVYVLWGARSRLLAALVYLVFTIPATIVLMVGPALVLMLQNLS